MNKHLIILILFLFSSFTFSQNKERFLFFDPSTHSLEKAIYQTTKKHALYSYNISNITTPGFEPILYPEDEAELYKMVPRNSEYFQKALLEHISTAMARNKNMQAAYLSIYKKKFDTYRQIATMGKR